MNFKFSTAIVLLIALSISAIAVGLVGLREFAVLRIASASISPTICDSDIVFAKLYSHDSQDANPENLRDRVVVYSGIGGRLMVKRVLGVGGDIMRYSDVAVVRNGNLALQEKCAAPGLQNPNGELLSNELEVDKSRVFVAGDNLRKSFDSRRFGTVPNSSLIGVVVFKIPSRLRRCSCSSQP